MGSELSRDRTGGAVMNISIPYIDPAKQAIRDEREFWERKLDAFYISLRNGWNFSWPADAPEWWTVRAKRIQTAMSNPEVR